ncbi:protein kinase domain-containing protein [Gordonia sp. NPDC003425]
MTLQPGSSFAGYTVIGTLGAGGMGQVYLVEHPHLLRRQALKVISVAGVGNAEFARRFTNEARTTATLEHPGIITIHDFGMAEDTPWFTMSYIDGEDLTAARLAPHEVFDVVARVADALDYAHSHDVIHRDVKPANIMVTRADCGSVDRVVVLDFGIAKLANAPGTSLTASNALVGTLSYCAPEIIEGAPAGARSDQYSLACTAYQLLTGAPPFTADAIPALMLAHLRRPAPRISRSRPELAALDPVFAVALAKDPGHRYPDCRSLAYELSVRGRQSVNPRRDEPATVSHPVATTPLYVSGPSRTHPVTGPQNSGTHGQPGSFPVTEHAAPQAYSAPAPGSADMTPATSDIGPHPSPRAAGPPTGDAPARRTRSRTGAAVLMCAAIVALAGIAMVVGSAIEWARVAFTDDVGLRTYSVTGLGSVSLKDSAAPGDTLADADYSSPGAFTLIGGVLLVVAGALMAIRSVWVVGTIIALAGGAVGAVLAARAIHDPWAAVAAADPDLAPFSEWLPASAVGPGLWVIIGAAGAAVLAALASIPARRAAPN